MGLKLEVFESQAETEALAPDRASAAEEERLAAYEQGYSAGWEDAANAANQDQTQIRGDLARSIQALGFTFHDARMHVLKALAPLIREMVNRLLPEVAHAALAPVVLETLMPLAKDLAEAPVELVLNPAARLPVETLLEHATGLPLRIVEEPTLGEGQVYLRLGETETRIDLDRATQELSTAVYNFFGLSEQDRRI
ncbi:flagellar biosynthesis protein [Gemmobacter lutimaris]|uniref:Flagellar biosynthesis protein n=1 Tax=Gemmobacter lutimaris TaxID=2306023 RepID=A0A398BJN6_9RHOB|nr:flagellar biosynthesis protein [Gemmobacter lutimaris]RID90899.1 flagellar biosynthesis protein [Gemmobacter lutimaris]